MLSYVHILCMVSRKVKLGAAWQPSTSHRVPSRLKLTRSPQGILDNVEAFVGVGIRLLLLPNILLICRRHISQIARCLLRVSLQKDRLVHNINGDNINLLYCKH